VKKRRISPKRKWTQNKICSKCHLVHPKTEILYDRDEFYLIERLDRLREIHNIKVHEITRPIEPSEAYSAKIEYVD
jgi:hypothetical protein